MQRTHARLFGPGLAAGGEPVELELTDQSLTIMSRPGDRVPLAGVRITSAGFNMKAWQLAWDTAAGSFIAHISDRPALDRLAAMPPAGLKAQIDSARIANRRRKRRNSMAWSLVIGILLLPLLAIGLLIRQAEGVAGWVADRISIEREKQLGELVFATMSPGLDIVEKGPAADAVRQIGARLTRGSRYTYQFKLAKSDEVNAFAVPGGIVVVYTGLLAKADSAEELAGVLAHEVQHIERRHSLKAMVHGLGLSALASVMLGDLSGGLAVDMAQQLAGLSFGRAQESDADLQGLNALRRAGIAPAGMLRFFRKMDEEGVTPPALLSSHPPSKDRFATLEAALQDKGRWTSAPLPYDWKAISKSLLP